MFVTLSDEQRRFVQTVRDVAQSEFRPRALQYMLAICQVTQLIG